MNLTNEKYPIQKIWILKNIIEYFLLGAGFAAIGMWINSLSSNTNKLPISNGQLLYLPIMFIFIFLMIAADKLHMQFSFGDDGLSLTRVQKVGEQKDLIPYGRINSIVVKHGLMERLFGIADVVVRTTRQSRRIPGLRRDDAIAIRDQVMAKVEAARSKSSEHLISIDETQLSSGKWKMVYKSSGLWRIIMHFLYCAWIVFFLMITVGAGYAVYSALAGIANISPTSPDAQELVMEQLRGNALIWVFGLPFGLWLLWTFWRSTIREVRDWFSHSVMYEGKIDSRNSWIGRRAMHHSIGSGGYEWMIDRNIYDSLKMGQEVVAVFTPQTCDLLRLYIKGH